MVLHLYFYLLWVKQWSKEWSTFPYGFLNSNKFKIPVGGWLGRNGLFVQYSENGIAAHLIKSCRYWTSVAIYDGTIFLLLYTCLITTKV